jgi:C4-dicarboxylate-binding protein DctP
MTLFACASIGLLLSLPVAAETKLRITLQLPLKSHLGQNLLQFKEEVERESNGDLVVEIYDSAQLYKDKEVPQAVASGAVEMGVASLTRFAGTIPAVDVFYVPFMFNNGDMVRAATNPDSKIRQLLDEAILDTGARVLWWQAYGGAIMLSKDGPLETPKDIEGKKVRVFGKTLGEFINTLGGSPTLISGSEQYLAYQRGTVDAGMTGVSGVKSRKLWQVMDWITVTNHADIEFVVLINEKFWQGLTDQQRAIITTAGRNAELAVRDEMSRIEEEAYQAAKDNGMQVQTLVTEQIDAWRAATQPVVDQYLSQSGDLGKQILEAAEELRQ